MPSRVQRLYGGPSSKTVRFVNMPHYMFYAPNLTSEELGGGPVMGLYPYLVNPRASCVPDCERRGNRKSANQ
jgi:hypothetical protein